MVKAKQKVLWAFSPSSQERPAPYLVETLQELSRQGAMIEPVYVLSPNEYDLQITFNTPWLNQIQPVAEKLLTDALQSVVISGLSRPKVIVEKRPSLTLSVRALLAYAKRQRADTIVVGTHARSGIARLLLGSFAETLLLHSTIPVLVVGPHVETSLSTRKRSRILFSTDFGPSAYPTFKKVVALARAQQSVTNPSAKITLFHCLPHPTEPIVRSGVYLLGGGYVSFPDYMTDEEQRKRKLAEEYVKAAKKMGVTVEIGLNPGHDGTAHAIVQEALAENANLIAMAAESGRVSAALIGSVTRQVVRTANCPVWVLRAKGA